MSDLAAAVIGTGFIGPVHIEALRRLGIQISNEDCGGVLLRFAGGGRGILWVSQVAAGRKNCLRFELGGSRQTLAWNSESPNQLWVGHRDRANELLARDPALLAGEAALRADYPGGHNEGFPDTFKQLFRDLYGGIESGRADASYPTFEDGHREMLICEAILKSHQTQRWVSVGE